MFDQQVNLLIYDYNIAGTRLGTHTAVFVYDEEFWFSIEGIKKRCGEKKYQFCEKRFVWEPILPGNLESKVRNLGSVSSQTKRPKEVLNLGQTPISKSDFLQHLECFLLPEFNRNTYSLTTLNCNTFCNAVITYLRPTNRELGRNRLNQIFDETDKTVQDVKETAVAVVDQSGQMIKTVAGVALESGYQMISSYFQKPPNKN
ncbi:Oidioi.mRNA.OKI2018_I69.chr2.g6521.t1.cds [Oikopleura dioica]|uniref:palmitoyl-protein hydrolase n=1 Tax=Oikopleura dioica TaxID=34765 RepID=A0ABN7T3D2_OIKDI|nr:Oidioi.mRNA.OKI2018_I69.chr2.g6521.t1.cds [Oikopleura dioica]